VLVEREVCVSYSKAKLIAIEGNRFSMPAITAICAAKSVMMCTIDLSPTCFILQIDGTRCGTLRCIRRTRCQLHTVCACDQTCALKLHVVSVAAVTSTVVCSGCSLLHHYQQQQQQLYNITMLLSSAKGTSICVSRSFSSRSFERSQQVQQGADLAAAPSVPSAYLAHKGGVDAWQACKEAGLSRAAFICCDSATSTSAAAWRAVSSLDMLKSMP
jgi:hypothetical protein